MDKTTWVVELRGTITRDKKYVEVDALTMGLAMEAATAAHPTYRAKSAKPKNGWIGEAGECRDIIDRGELIAAARAVVAFDWSDNDPDAVAAIERLRHAAKN